MIFNDGNQWHFVTDANAYTAQRDMYEMRCCTASEASGFRDKIVDTQFASQRALLQPRLKGYLHYQFVYQTAGTPEQQADYFADVLGELRPNEMVMLDIEGRSQILNPVDFTLRWLARIEARLNTKAWVYVPKGLAPQLTRAITGDRIVKAPDYDANDGQPHTPPTWPYDVWQYSSKAVFPGSPHGPGDINTTTWTTDALVAHCKGQRMGEARAPDIWINRPAANKGGALKDCNLAALHESVGITDALDLAAFMDRSGNSYHDLGDIKDGKTRLVRTVPNNITAFHLRKGNPWARGLCLTTPTAGYTREQWLGPQRGKVQLAAWWFAMVCKEEGLPVRRCTYEQIRAAVAGNHSAGGCIGHVDYTLATKDGTHVDPRNFPFDVALQWAQEYDQPQVSEGAEEMKLETEYDDSTGTLRAYGPCEGTGGGSAWKSSWLLLKVLYGTFTDVDLFFFGDGSGNRENQTWTGDFMESIVPPPLARHVLIEAKYDPAKKTRLSAGWVAVPK